MKYNSTQKRVFSSLLLSAGFVLFPSLALASYQPGQTLDPACPPSDGTCVVVPSTSQWTTSGSNIYFNTGNVGIGTTSPGSALSVQGNTLLSGNTSLGGTLKDLQGTPQSLFNSWAPRLWELADGTSLNPVTTSGATFKISRTEAVASTTCNGNNVDNECNAALLVEVNSAATAGFSTQQTAAIVANAKGQPIGTDVVGLTGVGDVIGSGNGIGTGAYIEGRRDTSTGKALGAEIRVSNITNTPGTYNPNGFSDTQGLWITASGPVSGAAIAIGHISQFITGLSFTTGSIATTTIEDNSSSVTSLQINGTHTYGLVIGPNGGKVGIGTLTPSFPLDILATSSWEARFQSSGSIRGAILIDNQAGGQQSSISLADAGAEKFQIGKQTDNSFYMYDASNTQDFFDYSPTSRNLALNRSAGKVGIGTTTPGTLLSIGNIGGINFTLATSSFSTTGGLNITGGCYAVNGVCLSGATTTSIATAATYNSTSLTAPYEYNGNVIAMFPQDMSGNYSTFYGINSGLNNNVTGIAKNLSTCFGANTCGGAGTGMTGTQPELVGIGWGTLSLITTGINDTAVGVGAMRYETTGSGNTALGTDAMGQSIGMVNTIAIGAGAVKFGANTSSIGIGVGALQGTTSAAAQYIVAIGGGAMGSTSLGVASNDVAIGVNAIANGTTTSYTTAIGSNALQYATGNSNTAVGNGAGTGITTGAGNIVLGVNTAASILQTGSSNILIGNSVDTDVSSRSNVLNIANTLTGYLSGNSATQSSNTAKIGIAMGTTLPLNTLDVNGAVAIGAAYAGSQTSPANGLLVQGNVGIGTTSPGSILSIGNAGGINFSLGTSTFSTTGGINISSGCFALNGVCLSATGGGASLSVANSWTALQTFSGGASSTAESVFNGAFFGATATSTFTSAGRLGILTASPSYPLDVTGFINTDQFSGFKQAGNTILFASSTSGITSVGQSTLANYFNSAANAGETAVGFQALQNATSSLSDTAMGFQALKGSATVSTGGSNTAFGFQTLTLNSSGGANVAIGRGALSSNTSGSNNIALGTFALNGSATAGANIAIGRNALFYNSTGNNNTALGYQAGEGLTAVSDYNTTIDNNMTFIGYGASRDPSVASTTALTNATAIGYLATVGCSNCLVLGGSGANAVKVGIGTSTPYGRLTVWGADAASSTLAFNVVNSASTTVFAVFDGGNAQLSGTLTQSSDQRLKTNIQSLDASTSLAAINSLTPVAYDWLDPNKGGVRQYGFIAQQVEQVFPNLVSTTSATALTPDGTLGLNYLGLIAPLVEAVQQLSAGLSSLEATVAGFANSFTTKKVTTEQLCFADQTGQTCVTKSQIDQFLSGTPSVQLSTPTAPTISGTTTPPSINIQGSNPATINVGDTYNDLGAIVHDNQGHDLSYRTFINGALSGNILIDTSQVATDTIDYVATDTWGNTATSTRTVIIEAATSSVR